MRLAVLGLTLCLTGCGGTLYDNEGAARARYGAFVGQSMTALIRAGIVPTDYTVTSPGTRLYVAEGSNVVQTISGPMLAYVPCRLAIEATNPTGAPGSDAYVIRNITFTGACG